jgi:hypothetical protein
MDDKIFHLGIREASEKFFHVVIQQFVDFLDTFPDSHWRPPKYSHSGQDWKFAA